MISSATIRYGLPARMPSAFWRSASVRSFRDIPVTCPCEWAMAFEEQRPSGWELAEAAPGCIHHGDRSGR